MKAPLSRLIVWALVCCFPGGIVLARTPVRKSKKKTPAVEQEAEAVAKPSATPVPEEDDDSGGGKAAPNATIQSGQIVEFSGELPRVKKLIESALVLTTLNLTYAYGSDDPANGGMDCSGFISYVLRQNGFSEVPRNASGQYAWLRKAGTFRAVLSRNSHTFELDELRPGDLLFWTGTYATENDPPVTHSMIYLGTEKGTNNRIMAGSSDGRLYHGKSRWGVSVFDFYLNGSSNVSGSANHPVFVGYARPPGLRD